MVWKQRIKEKLDELDSLFQPDELAYLALTQKVEHAVRDKLAFALHAAFGERDAIQVCREWRRVDLAVIKNADPLVLLEAKAYYTFDILKHGKPHDYPTWVLRDVEKLKTITTPGNEMFAHLLATHPHAPPRDQFRDAVKYFSSVSRYARSGIQLQDAQSAVRARLPDQPMIAEGTIPAGKAFDIEVTVAYWLFGPYQSYSTS